MMADGYELRPAESLINEKFDNNFASDLNEISTLGVSFTQYKSDTLNTPYKQGLTLSGAGYCLQEFSNNGYKSQISINFGGPFYFRYNYYSGTSWIWRPWMPLNTRFTGIVYKGSTSNPVSIVSLPDELLDGYEGVFYIDKSEYASDYPTALTSVSATLRIFVRVTKYSGTYSLFEVTAATSNVKLYTLKGLKINNTMYWNSTAL